MELYLQFGYGMMEHCRKMLSLWGGGTVVLSPRDLSAAQMLKFAGEVKALDGNVLLDPQLYVPDGEHQRLVGLDYWPTSTEYWRIGAELHRVLNSLIALNGTLGASTFILPSPLSSKPDDDWSAMQSAILDGAIAFGGAVPDQLFPTVALTSDAVRADDSIAVVSDWIDGCTASGIYLVCEHPNTDYLVGDPGWLANYLDLIASARLSGKRVVVGYCTHQMLICAAAGANAICSGTYMNVRSFPAAKFDAPEAETPINRSVWYYAPHVLSEFKISFLDIAKKVGVLDDLRTPSAFDAAFSDSLFTAPQPSLAGFTEQHAFRHYLSCLHQQVGSVSQASFADTTAGLRDQLLEAETKLAALRRRGVLGQQRDFSECFDVNRAALSALEATRGPIMERFWKRLDGS